MRFPKELKSSTCLGSLSVLRKAFSCVSVLTCARSLQLVCLCRKSGWTAQP